MTDVFVLNFHRPQENPDFHGVFTTIELAKAAVTETHGEWYHEPNHVWVDEDEYGFTVMYTGGPGGMPIFYIRRITLDVYEGSET